MEGGRRIKAPGCEMTGRLCDTNVQPNLYQHFYQAGPLIWSNFNVLGMFLPKSHSTRPGRGWGGGLVGYQYTSFLSPGILAKKY